MGEGTLSGRPPPQRRAARQQIAGEGPVARWLLTGVAMAFLALVLLAPLALVFSEALSKGAGAYIEAVSDRETLAALRLTLVTAAVSVPANLVFGVAAAWLIAKFEFRGKSLLVTLIDLPFAVSPVVAGLVFVLMFSSHAVLGPWLAEHGIRILFSPPAIFIATIFITFPFIARELIPLMEAQGSAEEEAALSLGASGWRTFFQVTLPNVKWGVLYGVLLCNARAMGEFGAVSLVSGHIIGLTNTLPLHVEILYNDNRAVAAFSAATLLAALALATLAAKSALEFRYADELAAGRKGR